LYAFINGTNAFLYTLQLKEKVGRLEVSALAEGLAVAEPHVAVLRCPTLLM
jgi:hypothetical protein